MTRTPRRRLLALTTPFAAGTLVVGLASPALAAATPVVAPSVTFTAPLDTEQEVPAPTPSDARGTASFALSADGSALDYRVITRGLEGTLAGHVHLGRPGETGPVVATLFSEAPIAPGSQGVDRDGVLAEGTIMDGDVSPQPDLDFDGTLASLLAEMRAGNAYVNFHTEDNLPGEIRGLVQALPADTGVNGTFSDDDRSVHEGAIETLHSAGVARGSTASLFLPGVSVTRAQTASFLARALHLDTEAASDAFTDDDGSVHEGSIDALAASGITVGCTTTTFCPDELITRGQLATLLDRALVLPPTTQDAFDDDDSDFHEDAINRSAAAGLTRGVTATTFEPARDLVRGQTASFVQRALGLAPTDVKNVSLNAGRVLVRHDSGPSSLVDDLRAEIEQDGGPGLVAEVDHVANAASVGLSLDAPLTTFFAGAPAAGTPLMQAQQTAGLDLPQRLVVTADGGDPEVDLTDPALVADRHGITGEDDRLDSIFDTLVGLATAGSATADTVQTFSADGAVEEGVGVLTYTSDKDFDATVDGLRSRLEAAPGVGIAAEVDHAAAAAAAGLELPPTTLFVFGDPAAGTPLLQASPLVALDLPQKMLVIETAGGGVQVLVNDPEYVTTRAGIDVPEPELAAQRAALAALVTGG